MADGETFKAYLPCGGTPPASMADIPLDFGTLRTHDALSARTPLFRARRYEAVALNLMRSICESCGQCTPCRGGQRKGGQAHGAGSLGPALLTGTLRPPCGDASICGLGQAAPNPLLCVLKFFPEEAAARKLVTRSCHPEVPAQRASKDDETQKVRPTSRLRRLAPQDDGDRLENGSMTTGSGAGKSVNLSRRPRGRGARRRDHLAGGQAADEIPHLCYSPEPGYRADGNCRACMVEIEGERVLAASCIRKPSAGMKVKAASERAKTASSGHFRPAQARDADAHDPASKFWAWAERMNVAASRFPAHGKVSPASIRRWRSISTPASNAISASVRSAGQRRHRPLAAAILKNVFDFDDPMASPAANACRPARPAR